MEQYSAEGCSCHDNYRYAIELPPGDKIDVITQPRSCSSACNGCPSAIQNGIVPRTKNYQERIAFIANYKMPSVAQ